MREQGGEGERGRAKGVTSCCLRSAENMRMNSTARLATSTGTPNAYSNCGGGASVITHPKRDSPINTEQWSNGAMEQWIAFHPSSSLSCHSSAYRSLAREDVLPEVELLDGILEGVRLQCLPPRLQNRCPRISPIPPSKLLHSALRLLHCSHRGGSEANCECGHEHEHGRGHGQLSHNQLMLPACSGEWHSGR